MGSGLMFCVNLASVTKTFQNKGHALRGMYINHWPPYTLSSVASRTHMCGRTVKQQI